MLRSLLARTGIGGRAGAVRLASSKSNPNEREIKPKKFERTPVGRLEEEPEKPKDEPPRRRIVNPETGEVGGPQGPEPTRYGDWERKGRVSDF
ncbi:Succinate dehydrogenase assembly factor 4, mitochondrial-like protein [Aphelenchoides fujianensis]|nr:Succinate dehydrogenase assembly factor 4, mitochondrial-like protein [Aphelenchoides fujianensis]